MTIEEFLLARIKEDAAHPCDCGRTLAECEAKREIIKWHAAWPVLVESPPTFDDERMDFVFSESMSMRVSRQIAWTTQKAYIDKFGTEPPAGPVLRFLALPYVDHPDYREEWRP